MISAWPPDDPTSPPARERVSTPRDEPRTIRASFAERSYASGEAALLTLHADAPVVTLRMSPKGLRARATADLT